MVVLPLVPFIVRNAYIQRRIIADKGRLTDALGEETRAIARGSNSK